MNTHAEPFARYEPNTIDGTEDFGGVFDLAGAAGRAARTASVFGGSDQGTASSQFPLPWSGLGMNPLGPTLRAETPTDPTVPPLPEEEGEVTVRMLAGVRELDASRVKLARRPAPTGSRGLPPAKAWQDWFTIRLRTWANVISAEFETELVRKVLGQPADLSRYGASDRQLAHEICFNIDDKTLPFPFLWVVVLSTASCWRCRRASLFRQRFEESIINQTNATE